MWALNDESRDRTHQLRILVSLHGGAVEAFLARVEWDPMVREELLADVVELAFYHIEELEQLANAQRRVWLLRAARNLTANASRRARTRRRLAERVASERLSPGASAEEEFFDAVRAAEVSERSERIRGVLNQLRPDDRRILTMNALGGTGPRIAEELGISHQAARSRLMRARDAYFAASMAAELGLDCRGAGFEDVGGGVGSSAKGKKTSRLAAERSGAARRDSVVRSTPRAASPVS